MSKWNPAVHICMAWTRRQVTCAALIAAVVVFALCGPASAEPCAGLSTFSYMGTQLCAAGKGQAYFFTASSASIKIDADGAPNAYHPDDVGKRCSSPGPFTGLDCPANAGYPGSSGWRNVLLPDPANPAQAYVQKSGAFAGYFLSQTTLIDRSKPDNSPERYVDASTVPYIVFPRPFHKRKGTGSMGDIGYAVNLRTGAKSAFIVAEVGPSDARLGEMSMALARALGAPDATPRTGLARDMGQVLFIVFPRSAQQPRWPMSLEALEDVAKGLLERNGGLEAITARFKK